jgi:hypothetical protein
MTSAKPLLLLLLLLLLLPGGDVFFVLQSGGVPHAVLVMSVFLAPYVTS